MCGHGFPVWCLCWRHRLDATFSLCFFWNEHKQMSLFSFSLQVFLIIAYQTVPVLTKPLLNWTMQMTESTNYSHPVFWLGVSVRGVFEIAMHSILALPVCTVFGGSIPSFFAQQTRLCFNSLDMFSFVMPAYLDFLFKKPDILRSIHNGRPCSVAVLVG